MNDQDDPKINVFIIHKQQSDNKWMNERRCRTSRGPRTLKEVDTVVYTKSCWHESSINYNLLLFSFFRPDVAESSAMRTIWISQHRPKTPKKTSLRFCVCLRTGEMVINYNFMANDIVHDSRKVASFRTLFSLLLPFTFEWLLRSDIGDNKITRKNQTRVSWLRVAPGYKASSSIQRHVTEMLLRNAARPCWH